MNNKEIDNLLLSLAESIPKGAAMLPPGVESELKLLNTSAMAIFTTLGEIAKRLPEHQPMTKREMIAAMIMQGMMSTSVDTKINDLTETAVMLADALIENLVETRR